MVIAFSQNQKWRRTGRWGPRRPCDEVRPFQTGTSWRPDANSTTIFAAQTKVQPASNAGRSSSSLLNTEASSWPSRRFKTWSLAAASRAKLIAWTLAKQGQKTVVVERSMVGGACPNVACLPSKNVIYSAKAVSLVHPTTGLGVVTGPVRVDMAGVARRKRQMVDELVEMHLANFKASGAELVMGEARFTEPKTVQVTLNAGGTRMLRGERVFINVGTRASMPDVPGLAAAGPMTHVEALNLERVPDHLVILGGGYVGLEFAQAMRRFGSRVTIIQRGPRLLEREDPDVADALLELMKDEGIEVLAAIRGAQRHGTFGHGRRTPGAFGDDGENARSLRHSGGGRPNAQHRPAGRGQGGRRAGSRGLHPRQRPAADQRPGRLGDGRMCRQPAVHARRRGRLSRRAGQSRRRQPDHARPAHSVLPVHRSGTGPRRHDRIRSQGQGRLLPHRPDADGDGPARRAPCRRRAGS